MTGPDLSKIRILIVDDNTHMRRILRAILSALGCSQIEEAGNGEEAMALLDASEPDILITDWQMPACDGITLVQRVRDEATSPCPFLPIIMLTGFASAQAVATARDSGVTEFLTKPVSAERLFQRMQLIIDRPRPFVRTKVFFGPDRRRRKNTENYSGPQRRDTDMEGAA